MPEFEHKDDSSHAYEQREQCEEITKVTKRKISTQMAPKKERNFPLRITWKQTMKSVKILKKGDFMLSTYFLFMIRQQKCLPFNSFSNAFAFYKCYEYKQRIRKYVRATLRRRSSAFP
jgi:hypothetical protein